MGLYAFFLFLVLTKVFYACNIIENQQGTLMTHLEKIAEYLLSTNVKATVVFFDSSADRFMITLAEKAANLDISSAGTLAEKLALVVENEELINSKILFPDGRSKFTCVRNSESLEKLKSSILSEVQFNGCQLVVFESDRIREDRLTYSEQVDWNRFKQVLKRGMGVDIVFFEDMPL